MPELVRISRVDPVPTDTGTLWLIKGETIEERPQFVTVKTTDQWKAALCERGFQTGNLIWMTWKREGFGSSPWLKTCTVDTTKFSHSEAV